ncbi:hypothetical protein [Kitasatospora griseola]|uniref:hypothetical protein n=1 Tax=Kitasatospora griseola TaxID=2064 RepID=UPI003819FAD9
MSHLPRPTRPTPTRCGGGAEGAGGSGTLVEPGGFGTDWSGPSAAHATPIDAYQPARDALAAFADGTKYGDPNAAATALLEVVDAEQPPLRVLFGAAPTHLVRQVYGERLRTLADRERVSVAAGGD